MRRNCTSNFMAAIVVVASTLAASPAVAHGPYAACAGQPGMMGQGMGTGMMGHGQGMGPGMMGQGQGMGPGMMGGHGQGMGPGMMGQGQGMGPGMMGGQGQGMGPGMMGCALGAGGGYLDKDLDVETVTAILVHRLRHYGNDRLRVGKVEAKDDDVIIAEIETVDGSLVERYTVDRHTGRMQRSG